MIGVLLPWLLLALFWWLVVPRLRAGRHLPPGDSGPEARALLALRAEVERLTARVDRLTEEQGFLLRLLESGARASDSEAPAPLPPGAPPPPVEAPVPPRPNREKRMVTREDLESYLLRTEQQYEEVEPGMWVTQATDGAGIVVHLSPPLLLLRAKVMDLPQDERQCAGLYRRLLELNASDLVHGAYGLEEDDVILTDSLELENLDFNEFQASIDSMQVALASHVEVLAPYRECKEPEGSR